VRWAALAAGAVTGLAMAVGLECLPYLLTCAAAFAVRYLIDPKSAPAAGEYGAALAASSLVGSLIIVGPDRWSHAACDEIAINWLALTAIGGGGLWAAAKFVSDQARVRCMQVTLVGVLAAALFVWIEPRCLRGPYAMMDPAVWPIWLAQVREMKPLVSLTIESPLTGIAIATFPLTALIAVLALARSRSMRGNDAFLVATATFLVSAVMTLAAVKAASYAIWFAMPLVAVFALYLFNALRLQSLAPRVAVGVMLTPAVISLGAITLANAAGLGAHDSFNRTESDACFKSESYATLAQLPRGLIVTDIDYGSFILALTPHIVVAAPYHRLAAGILTAHLALASPPDEARRVLAGAHADYVGICGKGGMRGLDATRRDASLWGRLHAGAVPDWLAPLPVVGPFTVYRVKQ